MPATSFPFVKMHGAANDFVVLDHRTGFLPPEGPGRARLVARLCDRRRGIGADGVLLLEPADALDFAMRYYNADGTPADYCGNGARCIARFALERGLGDDGSVRFRTDAGVQQARRAPDGAGIELDFGRVREVGPRRTVQAAGRSFEGRLIRAGVPHFVIPVEQVEAVPLGEWAPPLRRAPEFGAEGANVDFVARLEPGRIAMRTWERGVEGETLACGSGAIASALWAGVEGGRSPIRVATAGGDELRVGFERAEDGYDVTLTGPAETAFTGTWNDTGAGSGAWRREEETCSKD